MGALGLYKDGKKVDRVQFPVTSPGNSSTVKLQVRNEAANFVDITKIIIHSKDVIIKKAPKGLEPYSFQKESKDLIVTWSPKVKTKPEELHPLNTSIEFEEVLG